MDDEGQQVGQESALDRLVSLVQSTNRFVGWWREELAQLVREVDEWCPEHMEAALELFTGLSFALHSAHSQHTGSVDLRRVRTYDDFRNQWFEVRSARSMWMLEEKLRSDPDIFAVKGAIHPEKPVDPASFLGVHPGALPPRTSLPDVPRWPG